MTNKTNIKNDSGYSIEIADISELSELDKKQRKMPTIKFTIHGMFGFAMCKHCQSVVRIEDSICESCGGEQ